MGCYDDVYYDAIYISASKIVKCSIKILTSSMTHMIFTYTTYSQKEREVKVPNLKCAEIEMTTVGRRALEVLNVVDGSVVLSDGFI